MTRSAFVRPDSRESMKWIKAAVVVLWIGVLLGAGHAYAQSGTSGQSPFYTVTDLDPLLDQYSITCNTLMPPLFIDNDGRLFGETSNFPCAQGLTGSGYAFLPSSGQPPVQFCGKPVARSNSNSIAVRFTTLTNALIGIGPVPPGCAGLQTTYVVPNTSLEVFGMNSRQDAAGFFDRFNNVRERGAVLLSGGNVHYLGTLAGSSYTEAQGVDDFGTVVGSAYYDGNCASNCVTAARFANGSWESVGALVGEVGRGSRAIATNNVGQIIGNTYVPTDSGTTINWIAWMLSGTVRTDLPFPANVTPGSPYLWMPAAINNFGVVVGILQPRSGQAFVPVIFADGRSYDLNSLIGSSSGWQIQNVTDINDHGQIIARATAPDNVSHPVILEPTSENPFPRPVPNVQQAQHRPSETEPQIIAGTQPPPTQILKRNLVLLTHGWNSNADGWARPMGEKIRAIIDERQKLGLNPNEQWDVWAYDWSLDALTKDPWTAYVNASAIGRRLADRLAVGAYDHIHFVAHSAGSNLIETATTRVRHLVSLQDAKQPTIHATFLDAFSPNGSSATYGMFASWAEQYVDKRGLLGSTNYTLPGTYNFDISALDENQFSTDIHYHAWPYNWYRQTVDSPVSTHYGINLAREYGGTPPSHDEFPRGVECVVLDSLQQCGSSSSPTIPIVQVAPVANPFDIWVSPDVVSVLSGTTGQFSVSRPGTIELTTGSPVWVTLDANVTQAFNSLEFGYRFTSAAEGLLSVFLDDQVVFKADERHAEPGVSESGRISVGNVAPGRHSLSFRLDHFSAVASAVEISGIAVTMETIARIENQRPISNAGADRSARLGSRVMLDGNASNDPDARPSPLTYAWTQVGGPPVPLFEATAAKPNFVPTTAGTYSMSLAVNDGQSTSEPATAKIIVPVLGDLDLNDILDNSDLKVLLAARYQPANGPNDIRDLNGDGLITDVDVSQLTVLCGAACNQPPIAVAGANQSLEATAPIGTAAKLDGSSSTDPDGDTLTFTWAGPFGTAAGPTPTVTLPLGANVVTLTVSDGKGGTATATVSITVVDTIPPAISIASPTVTVYRLRQTVASSYNCQDGGSGVASCTGPAPNGSLVDTASVGTKTFTVSASDKVGNAISRSLNCTVGYGICPLYDQTKAHKSGSTVPIKLQLCDINAANASASNVVVHATGLTQRDTTSTSVVEDSGSANPDDNFRFDATIGGTGGYIFNLSTKGLSTGTWILNFMASGDPTTHSVQFDVR